MRILVVFFISQPLINRRAAPIRRHRITGQPISVLQAERDRVIRALQELDFDYSLGKVPEEDYLSQRNTLLQEGAEVLQKLDALQPQTITRKAGARLEDALDARGKATPQTLSVSNTAQQYDNLEALIASRRRDRNGSSPREKSIGFCPQCGKSILKSDRFCPKCGREQK